MLRCSKHWHVASSGPLEWEHRLLGFAGPATPGNSDDDTLMGRREAQEEEARIRQYEREYKAELRMEAERAEARRRVDETLRGETPDAEEETAEEEDATEENDQQAETGVPSDEAEAMDEIDRDVAEEREAVEETTGQTVGGSDQTQGTHPDRREGMPSGLTERLRDIKSSFDSIAASMEKMNEEAEEKLDDKQFKVWEQNLEFLKLNSTEAGVLQRASEKMDRWKSGDMPPSEFMELLTHMGFLRAQSMTIRDNMGPREQAENEGVKRRMHLNLKQTLRDTDDPEGQRWHTLTVGTQLIKSKWFENVEAMPAQDQEPPIFVKDLRKQLEEHVENQVASWEEALDLATKDLHKVQIATKEDEEEGHGGEQTIIGEMKQLWGKVPLKFYSFHEVYEAAHSVWEAYKEAYKQHSHLKAASLAKKMGRLVKHLPWGHDVEPILDRELDERNDGIMDKYAQYLSARNASYEEIFGDHGELELNSHDGNRARGVLKYAAERGWLFDIDFNTKASDGTPGFRLLNGHTLRYYDLVPNDWNDVRKRDAYAKLLTAQNAGKKQESEKYYNRYYNLDRAADFVDKVDEELKKYNIWAVHGIVKRSIERGLSGEVAPWHAVTIMNQIERDEKLRRIITRDWLDQLGNLSVYRTAFMIGGYKVDRFTMPPWCESGDKDIRNAGFMGKLISKVREDITTRTGRTFSTPEEQKELTHKIAQIMAAQPTIVEDNKGHEHSFTIFDARYNYFRNHKFTKEQGDLSPGVREEDPDYFTNISENHWAGERPVAEIFARTGQGEFQHVEKAMHYAGHILMIYDDLADPEKSNNLVAAENYRREMGYKLSRWIWQSPLGDSRSPGLDAALIKGVDKYAGKPALNTLLKHGFIDVEPLIRACWKGAQGIKLAQHILQADNPGLFARYQKFLDDKKTERPENQYWEMVNTWRAAMSRPITFLGQDESVALGKKAAKQTEDSETTFDIAV